MLTSILGVLVLVGSVSVAFLERTSGELGFFDWHAMVVVFGGVLGSLLVATEPAALINMLKSMKSLFQAASGDTKTSAATVKTELASLKEAWNNERRAEVLEIAEASHSNEIKEAAEALIGRDSESEISERFLQTRNFHMERFVPVIEGWEMVSRLAPSFGMVGTVTGMVQLFKNMADQQGNLGGAMAMALLATLYGIAMGAAVGGPMSARLTNQLNSKLGMIDLVEQTTKALIAKQAQ